MNEETPNPFDTVGDAPVEARIVAWVLGEASAFEAAELERLCEESPELLIFHRRMLALHGLLAEAETSAADPAWKLSSAKRGALDEILGQENVIPLDSQKELRVRRAGKRAFFAIAACLVLAVVVLQLVRPVWRHQIIMAPEKKVDFMPPGGAGGEGSFGSGGVAMQDAKDSGGIDITGGTSFKLGMSRSDGAKREESLSASRGMIPDQKEAVPTLAARPGTYKVDSAAATASREPGLQQAARQSQLAKQAPRARGDEGEASAALAMADRDAIPESEAMPPVVLNGMSGALGGAGGIGTDRALPASPAKPAAPAEPASTADPRRAGGRAPQGGVAMAGKKTAGERFDARLSGSFDGKPAEANAVDESRVEETSELAAEKGRKADESQTLADAEPPVVFGNESGVSKVPVVGRLFSSSDSAESGEISQAQAGDKSGPAQVQTSEALSNLAEREMVRRQNVVSEGDALLLEGREAYAKGDYQQASEKYGRAMEKLPDTPALGDRRKSYTAHLADADVALAMQNRKVGKYEEARKLLEGVKAIDPGNADVNRELSYLDDPLRTNPALTYEHKQNVDKVRRNLYAAEGNYNLGKYDDSKKAYEEVLRTDPNNAAARRGLERIETAKSDYYRAAYDHSRAEISAEVDKAWELAVPADGKIQDFKGRVDYGSPIQEGAKNASAEAAQIKIQREFNYPNEYESPELPNPVAKSKAVFPTTPATPDSFDTRNAGTTTAVEPVVPKPALVDLMEEIPAAENPYSTFSLNISDASFQMAKASLAKGERPDPASIKPEQFYNAVDYGDPAPTANEPVAATIEQSAHPFIPGRNLVRVALRTGSIGRSAAQPLRLTLLVDQSGSMVREDRRASMEHALAQLGVLLTKNDLVTVVGFSRTPHLLADGMAGDQATKLGELVNQTASEGGTNLEEALKLGRQMAERHQLAGAQNRIVLFTDGAANLGDADPARLAEQVKALRQKGISFDIAGIGADGLNDQLLGEMARNGNGRYYVVGSEKNDSFARQLAGAFRPAAENVKVQVIFNPQRVGKYQLIGFEKDRLKTEDFRNDAVDAAELAAEEAGVAIYQVEPLAGGTGELGEVSVRFRDAAGGQMVERSWTIPHDARATAFDRATPSMQLAGLSLFAAEKLKGGPLADAIDFQQLAGSSAFVKQFYGNSPRVSDMLQVIEKLK